jgi:hypothetical protein
VLLSEIRRTARGGKWGRREFGLQARAAWRTLEAGGGIERLPKSGALRAFAPSTGPTRAYQLRMASEQEVLPWNSRELSGAQQALPAPLAPVGAPTPARRSAAARIHSLHLACYGPYGQEGSAFLYQAVVPR